MSPKNTFSNHLINASSPYLLQHVHNPVDWHQWGDEALAKAREEDKLLLISIGYAACHWCHVMAHQSFENEEVAKLMNQHFINIKVDREERPDIDQIYMLAAQLSTGHGGWPLNVFALPDGRPFYGGTYYPKEQWINMVKHMATMYKDRKNELITAADSLTRGINQSNIVPHKPGSSFSIKEVEKSFENWKAQIDFEKGGDKGATHQTPKFPMPNNWEFLMKFSALSGNTEAATAVNKTLTSMAMGGIYDQVGGGFTRYSTDQYWLIPHFEKMLYDNAQLIGLYSRAYQWTQNKLYKDTVLETIEWLQREMTDPSGGFYSSLDADSEGEEGKFYVWDYQELEKVAGKHHALLFDFYSITKEGNFEGKNNLNQSGSLEDIASNHNFKLTDAEKIVKDFKAELLDLRSKRIRPGLDDKIITSWNALTISGLIAAYRAFDNDLFLKIALDNLNFIETTAIEGVKMFRINKNGKISVNAFLDDYAFTMEAMLDVYMVTFDESLLIRCKNLLDYVLIHFKDADSELLYYTADTDPTLVARKMEISDNVVSSSNSAMAHILLKLGLLLNNADYLHLAEQMVHNVEGELLKNARFYSNWGRVYLDLAIPPFEVAILGKEFSKKRKEIDREFIPNMLLLGGLEEGNLELLKGKLLEAETMIYVCQNKTCDLPTKDPNQALKIMNKSTVQNKKS